MTITLVLVAVFLVVVASIWWFGAWSNLMTLVNTIIAGLMASSFFENVAYQLDKIDSSLRLLWQFVGMWLLFALTFILLRAVTDSISRYQLKLDKITELVSRSVLSIAVGLVFVGFVAFSLHRAPLPQVFFQPQPTAADRPPVVRTDPIDFAESETFGPDRAWAGMVRLASTGSLAYPAEETEFFPALQIKITNANGDLIPDPTVKVREFNRMGTYFNGGKMLRSTINRQETLRVSN